MAITRPSPRPHSLQALISLRATLLEGLERHPSWAHREERIGHFFREYFAARPPSLLRIDATSPRPLLAWIVRHEAVHAFNGLRDLRRRLEADRRCYALVCREMPDMPVAFMELAFGRDISGDVTAILDADSPVLDPASCDSAMFYSISSCHDGLRGVPFGNLLIRHAVEAIQAEVPSIRTFATVSPVSGFRPWLSEVATKRSEPVRALVALLEEDRWHERADRPFLQQDLLPLCASYLLKEKRGFVPHDPVARFHLGNGARLERINWLGDRTVAGLKRSAGFTANYVYDLATIDANRAAYHAGTVVAAAPVIQLAHIGEKSAA